MALQRIRSEYGHSPGQSLEGLSEAAIPAPHLAGLPPHLACVLLIGQRNQLPGQPALTSYMYMYMYNYKCTSKACAGVAESQTQLLATLSPSNFPGPDLHSQLDLRRWETGIVHTSLTRGPVYVHTSLTRGPVYVYIHCTYKYVQTHMYMNTCICVEVDWNRVTLQTPARSQGRGAGVWG